MFPIAGQSAGPNGLAFLWTLVGSLGVKQAKKHFFLSKIDFLKNRNRALQLMLK